MQATKHQLSPPSLEEIAKVLASALPSNYNTSSATVVDCPDLRDAPFKLACEGLSGSEVAADIGGQANLYPQPRPDKQYSLTDCAKLMGLPEERGAILGAEAGPAHVHGMPSELAPHLSWQGGFDKLNNLTRSARLSRSEDGQFAVGCPESHSSECALMMNLYGSLGLPGPVIKVTAQGRKGDVGSFTDFTRFALREAFGENRQVSLGGVFILKKGKARYHVMPPFPPAEELPFKSQEALDGWLSYHDFDGPMVGLAVLHSADPEQIGVRLEHTHCFSNERGEGGHYHFDLPGEEVEYEGYFNTIKTFYQIDKPDDA
ncbi:hypothetical protein NW762_010759 [Fusarium torreyae]|uniref:DUF1907 domain-containing protein n=1 Tax=Fusarium torreyae TaxID=1237075 RepID=A0A9W8RQY2_9HYPO|nr:hypothetical protein NW762_010759 [Fusarium torreyae]